MKKIKEAVSFGLLFLVGLWIISALSFNVYMMYVSYFNPKKARNIVNQLDWKLDGTFKNNPNNIWYTASNK